MFKVKADKNTTELIFSDSMGRECAIAGVNPGQTGGMMFGLRELKLLVEVNGELVVAPTRAIAIEGGGKDDDPVLLRGAPMALGRNAVAALIPIFEHFVRHGCMPEVIAITGRDEPAIESDAKPI